MSVHKPLRPSNESIEMSNYYIAGNLKNISNTVGIIKKISPMGMFIIAQYEYLSDLALDCSKRLNLTGGDKVNINEIPTVTRLDRKRGKIGMTEREKSSLLWFAIFAEKQLPFIVSMSPGAQKFFAKNMEAYNSSQGKITFTETVSGKQAQPLPAETVGKERSES